MSAEDKVPAIRFLGFGDDISSIKLKEVVVSNTYGPRFNANDYDVNGNVKTIRGTDISLNGNILYNQVPIASLDTNFIKSHILEDGDLVMITTADCGLTGIFEEQNDKYICSAYAVKITLNKALAFPHYFKYFFQTTLAKNEVNKFIRKATVANLPASGILKITHRLPSRQEQEKIALFLTSLYKLIAQHQQKHDKLLNLKKALLEKVFPKQGVTEPEIRFKGFGGEWEENELHQVVDVRSGRDYKHLLIGDIPVFGTGGYMLSVNEALSYNEDAIGIGRKGTIDKPYVLKAPFWTVDTLFYAVPCTKNNLNFVYAIFQKINWRQKDESTGVPSLSKVAINHISVFTTGETEQTQIGNLFKQLDTLLTQHQAHLKKLHNIKQACLEKMFV
ncbi:MAG: restriction endonuclease subunit S [Methyloprofundus sp.]|nr:restriction endonuclease subunit S [Methyloprofundus sp.]